MAQTHIELKSPKLLPWQRDVAFSVFEHFKGTIHTVKSKRQVGKSVLLENILLKVAIENRSTDSFVVSPTTAQASKIYSELLKAIRNTPVYRAHNSSSLIITFSNSSTINFKSAEQRDNLRGYTVTGILCIDEAAYISDDVISDILPWVDANNAPVIFTSTPIGRQGLFYKFFTEGEEDNVYKYFSYDWSKYDTSQLLTEERKEFYRRTLPKQKYITDILGEFLDGDSVLFGEYGEVMTSDIDQSNHSYYFGIDWGSGVGQDETAISIFNSNREQVELIHFNDKDETQTINTVIELCKQYKPLKVTVETNSIGRVFYGLLDKAIRSNRLPIQLCGFTTTNDTKERIINELQVAIQNKDIVLRDDAALQTQLSMYEMKISPNGKRIYNAKSGYHDDLIIATAIGLHSISTGRYSLL